MSYETFPVTHSLEETKQTEKVEEVEEETGYNLIHQESGALFEKYGYYMGHVYMVLGGQQRYNEVRSLYNTHSFESLQYKEAMLWWLLTVQHWENAPLERYQSIWEPLQTLFVQKWMASVPTVQKENINVSRLLEELGFAQAVWGIVCGKSPKELHVEGMLSIETRHVPILPALMISITELEVHMGVELKKSRRKKEYYE
jgi:hypothetical protein